MGTLLAVLSIIAGVVGVSSLVVGLNTAISREGHAGIGGLFTITSRGAGAVFFFAGSAVLAFSVYVLGLLR